MTDVVRRKKRRTRISGGVERLARCAIELADCGGEDLILPLIWVAGGGPDMLPEVAARARGSEQLHQAVYAFMRALEWLEARPQ